jgi:hypothetical protein
MDVAMIKEKLQEYMQGNILSQDISLNRIFQT